VSLVLAEALEERPQICAGAGAELSPGLLEQDTLEPRDGIESTAVADNEPLAQSVCFRSSSSISQSGLTRSQLPANDDRDW
jgi:hypothetical protein